MPHGGSDDIQPEKSTHEYMHAFEVAPEVSFETQSGGEKVLLLIRAHPLTQLSWIFNSLVFLLLLILFNMVAMNFVQLTVGQAVFLNIFIFNFILSYVFFNFVTWYYNVGIITNERIVDIDFMYLIYKEVSGTELEKVEDVTAKTGGYFASLFNFGDVFLQTAGSHQTIEFLKVPKPAQVVKIMSNLLEGKQGE